MSVVELHPEELLDREARGELSEGERRRLDAHRAHCTACRAESRLRSDFAAELDGEEEVALPNLGALLAGVTPVERASGGGDPAAPLAREVQFPRAALAGSGARKWRRTGLLLVAAALVVVSAAAGAGVRTTSWLRLVTSTFVPDSAQPAAAVDPKAPTRALGRTAVVPKRLVAPAADDVLFVASPLGAPVVAETSSAPEAPGVVAPPPRAVVALGPGATSTAGAPRAAVRRESTVLFEAERAARLRGDYAKVLALHQDLVARYPQSREAQASRATVGQLLLDRGDPTGALASFDAYAAAEGAAELRGTEELSEVVLVGRATALDRLGRADEARRAWRALLVTFPDTPYARHATARLGAPFGESSDR